MSASHVETKGGRNELQPPGSARAAEPGSWERLDQLLEELPPGYPILSDEDRDDFSKYQNAGPRLLSKEEAWQDCAHSIERHDTELCKGYREEIDTLLVFAGLFSAVVTAFTIDSYKWLQDDPNDAIIGLLSQIALSVASNESAPIVAPAPSGLPSSAAARINIYWFLALALSLSAALIAILCKQWLREFERNVGHSAQEYVSVRQVKFEGFQRYRVGAIVAALPLLLQLALAVFALGVAELLWRLHTSVAIAVCIPAVLAFSFYLSTAVLPATQVLRDRCMSIQYPFKSPQAWLVVSAYQAFVAGANRIISFSEALFSLISMSSGSSRLFDIYAARQLSPKFSIDVLNSWRDWDLSVHFIQCNPHGLSGTTSYARGLTWLYANETRSTTHNSVWNCHWHETLLLSRWERHTPRRIREWPAISRANAWKAHRMSTLDMLFRALYPCSRKFHAELFIRNLALMDPSEVWSLSGLIDLDELDGQFAVTVTRELTQYIRMHGNANTGWALLQLGRVVLAAHPPLLPALRACVSNLIIKWVHGQRPPASMFMPECACIDIVRSISQGRDLNESLEMLYELPCVQDVSAMTRAIVECHPDATGLRLSWPLSPDVTRLVSRFLAYHDASELEPLMLGLLEISVRGTSHYASQRAATEHCALAPDDTRGVPSELTKSTLHSHPLSSAATSAYPPPQGSSVRATEDALSNADIDKNASTDAADDVTSHWLTVPLGPVDAAYSQESATTSLRPVGVAPKMPIHDRKGDHDFPTSAGLAARASTATRDVILTEGEISRVPDSEDPAVLAT